MHPIFDGPGLKWTDPDVQNLHKLLSRKKIYNKPEAIELLYDRAGDNLPAINTSLAPSAVWKQALDYLHESGSLRNFCQQLLNDGPPSDMKDVISKIFARESVTELNLIDGSPVLDRQNLRPRIAALSSSDSSNRVLVIRGEKQSGKTHSRLLFSQAAKASGATSVYLRKGQVNNLREVLNEIFAPIGGFTKERDVKVDTTDNAWHKVICSELLKAARKEKTMLWIAMDNLGKEGSVPHLEPEIKEFFDQLVVQMSNDVYQEHFRLMLIDYPSGDTPQLWEERLWEEDRTSQDDVREEHVIAFIKASLQKKNKQLPEDTIREKAASIIRTAEQQVSGAPPENPVYRIKAIDALLKDYLKTL